MVDRVECGSGIAGGLVLVPCIVGDGEVDLIIKGTMLSDSDEDRLVVGSSVDGGSAVYAGREATSNDG